MCRCHMLTLFTVMTAQHPQELLDLPSQRVLTGSLMSTQALMTGTLLIPSDSAMRRFMVSNPFSQVFVHSVSWLKAGGLD